LPGGGLTRIFGPSPLLIALPALIVALLAAFLGDDFWSAIGTVLAELIGWWGGW
jgi:hypothetical protein